jgi:hypothetical protein
MRTIMAAPSETIFKTCCGCEWATNFCPNCGKRLVEVTPLEELQVHIRKIEGQSRKAAERRSRWKCGDNDDSRKRNEKIVKQHIGVANKWKRWGDALDEILGTPEVNHGAR